jgi:phage-related holin
MATTQDILSAAPHALGRLAEAAPTKLLIASGAVAIGWLTTPGAYQVAVWMLILDWITGFAKGLLVERHLRSGAMVRGAVKSTLYLVMLGCGWMMTQAGPIADLAAQALAFYVITTEAISNLENLQAIGDRYGVEAPALRGVLRMLRIRAEEIAPEEPTTKEETHADQP